MKIRIQKHSSRTRCCPTYAHGPEEDAGMDLRAVEDVTLAPGRAAAGSDGPDASRLPPGYEAQVRPRSGLALKHAITMPNRPAPSTRAIAARSA